MIFDVMSEELKVQHCSVKHVKHLKLFGGK